MADVRQTRTGTARVDDKIQRLSARIEPGDIAVINYPDLDRSSAQTLLGRRPVAVLNVASSTTGRRPGLGAQLLVDGGVILLDDFGADLGVIREGEQIEIRGNEVFAHGQLIAVGQQRTARDIADSYRDGKGRLDIQVNAFAQGAAILWQREHATLLEGVGVPRPPRLAPASTVVIVGQGEDTAKELRRLRKFGRDYQPLVMAIGEAANQVSVLGRTPDFLVGDLDNVSEKILRSGAELILLERPDGSVPGLTRVTNYGLRYSLFPSSASAMDAAILLADINGAEQIVTVGADADLEEFFDQSSSEITSGFFIRVRAATKLVASGVVLQLYRPRIANWQLVWLMLAALIALGAAVWVTPWGHDLYTTLWEGVSALWSGPAGIVSFPDMPTM